MAHPNDYSAGHLAPLCIAGICIVFFAVALRFWGRRHQKIPILADDWTLLAATFLSCAAVVMLLIKCYHYGFGKHYFTLTPETQLKFGLYDYPFNLLYTTGYPLSRISLVLLYRRVFESRRWFSILSYALIAAYIGYMIGTLFADIFTDTPIRAYWDHTMTPTHAINGVALYVFNTSFNIATDMILLIVPNFIIWRMGMTVWQKVGLSCIFALGVLTLIASILRLIFFYHIKVYDVSYTLVDFATWTAVELFLGILCPCLVTFGPLVRMAWQVMASYKNSLFSNRSSNGRRRSTLGEIGTADVGEKRRPTTRYALERKQTVGSSKESSEGTDSEVVVVGEKEAEIARVVSVDPETGSPASSSRG